MTAFRRARGATDFEAHVTAILPATVYTPNVPKHAGKMMIMCHTGNVRWTLDGSAPSATHGFLMVANAAPFIIDLNETVTPRFFTLNSVLEIQYGA